MCLLDPVVVRLGPLLHVRASRVRFRAQSFRDAVNRENAVELRGFEPLTPCLQSRCSSQLSYSPESRHRSSGRADRRPPPVPVAVKEAAAGSAPIPDASPATSATRPDSWLALRRRPLCSLENHSQFVLGACRLKFACG